MRSLLLPAVLGLACVTSAWPSAAAAQAAVEASDPPGYAAVVDEAIGEYAAGRFEEARALFTRAHAISPNARTLRGLGMVAFELRNYAECVQHLEAALASKDKALTGELREQTEGLLGRARGFVGRVELRMQPANARVSVDGVRVEQSPTRALDLDVGDHQLEFSAAGYASERRKVRVNGGETRVLEVDLTGGADLSPEAAAQASTGGNARGGVPDAATHAEDDGGSVLESPWFWVAAVAVAAGTAVGLGIALSGEETREQPAYGGNTDVILDGP